MRRLQRVARDEGRFTDVHRMFLAALLDGDNARTLARSAIRPGATVGFSLASIRAGMPDVKALGRPSRTRPRAAPAVAAARRPVPPVPGRPTADGGSQVKELLLARKPRPKGQLQVNEKDVAKRLPSDRDFDWFGSQSSPKLVAKRDWLLKQGVSAGTSRITGADYPGVIRPVMGALIDKYPYAESRRAEILADIDSMSIDIGEDTWQDEEMEFSVARSVYTTLGLPPDMPVQIFEVDRGLEILADLTTLAGQDVASRILIAIEAATKVPVLPGQRPVVLQALAAMLKGKKVAYMLVKESECNRFFGEVNWRKHLTDKPAGEAGEDGAVIFTAGGAFQPSSDLSDKDRKMVEEVMTKLFGAAKADPKAPALQLSKGEVDLLRQLSKDPKRLEAIREILRAARQRGKGAPSLAEILQSAAAALEFREWAKLLNVPVGSGSGEEPIVKRPVHGVIINKTGELVPKQEARFSFQELDVVDAFRVPMVNIKWVAVPEASRDEVPDAAKVIRREGTYYAALGEESLINDKTFQVTFQTAGIYEIHAFVNHNFYNPAHFSIRVEVKPENARLAALDEKVEDTFGTTTGVKTPHTFSDVSGEDTAVSWAVGGAAFALLAPPSGYEKGSREVGFLTDDAGKANAFDRSSASIDEEIAKLDKLTKQLTAQDADANADLLRWIKEKRGRLETSRQSIVDVKGKAGTHPVMCQGSYVTRSNQARGGPMQLLSWFTYDAEAKSYNAELIDRSQLVVNEDLRIKASASKFETAMEHLFFELTRVYPDGVMSFAFQVYENETPTGRFVRFTRKTDTMYKDVKNVVFSRPANIAVNVVATVLTVFPPTTAAGIALSVTYNGTAAALEAADASRTGTLHASHIVNIGLVALDLLPAVGRTARLLETSRGFVWVVRSAQYAGQAYMLTENAYLRIKQVRDNQVTRLAELQDKIARARETNASDPDLEGWENEAAALKAEIRNVTTDVIADSIKTDGLTIAAMHTVGKLAEAHLGHRGGGTAAPHEAPGTPAEPGKPTPHDATVPKETPPPVVKKATELPPGSDPHLASGLPPELRQRVSVVADSTIKGEHSVEVHYTLDALGLVSEVQVRVKPGGTPQHVAEHARTVQLMLDYQGVSGLARVVFDRISGVLGRAGRGPKVGSRAWEAKLEVEKLPRIIQARMEQLAAVRGSIDEATATVLQHEIDYLKEQLERHRETFNRFDEEQGRGFVAATGDHTKEAVKEGYPRLDKAPGHYYEPKPDGGYELRQFANSNDKPMELAIENGRWTVREAKPPPEPATQQVEKKIADLQGKRQALQAERAKFQETEQALAKQRAAKKRQYDAARDEATRSRLEAEIDALDEKIADAEGEKFTRKQDVEQLDVEIFKARHPLERAPQDLAVSGEVAEPPKPLPGRAVGRTPNQEAQLRADIAAALKQGADPKSIRINERQVDANGKTQGVNRPDLQYTVDGKRVYIEYEQPSNPRGLDHATRIIPNDPTGKVIVKLVPKDSAFTAGQGVKQLVFTLDDIVRLLVGKQ